MSTTPMTQERLDAIRERVDAAQNTPWQRDDDDETDPAYDDYTSTVNDRDGDPIGHCPDCGVRSYYSTQNADLTAHAPEDLADLLAEVERLRALTTVDDDMVERALRQTLSPKEWRAFCDSEDDYDFALVLTYRDQMRDTLNAALSTGEVS